MAAIDAKGGLGLAGINNVLPLAYDKFARRGAVRPEASYVTSLCDPAHPMGRRARTRRGASFAAPQHLRTRTAARRRIAAPAICEFLDVAVPRAADLHFAADAVAGTTGTPGRPSNT